MIRVQYNISPKTSWFQIHLLTMFDRYSTHSTDKMYLCPPPPPPSPPTRLWGEPGDEGSWVLGNIYLPHGHGCGPEWHVGGPVRQDPALQTGGRDLQADWSGTHHVRVTHSDTRGRSGTLSLESLFQLKEKSGFYIKCKKAALPPLAHGSGAQRGFWTGNILYGWMYRRLVAP